MYPLSFVDGMAQRKIPLSVFHFDCYWMKENEWCGFQWDEDVFPDVEGSCAVVIHRHGAAIIGCGRHEELMERCAEYKEISDSQMGGAFLD